MAARTRATGDGGSLILFSDMTEQKRAEDELATLNAQLAELALTDSLTGLYNRRYLMAHLEGLMTRAAEGPQGPAVLMIDIDFFKRVNDTYGHPAGDAALREVASRIARHVRAFDLVARYGGEEFVVVMPETPLPVASMVAERLRSTVATKAITLGDGAGDLKTTISIGIAITREGGDNAAALLQRADKALYQAKAGGRNCVAGSVAEILPISEPMAAAAKT